MSREACDKEIQDVIDYSFLGLADGIGVVIYIEQNGEEFDYFWDIRKMEQAG